MKAMLQIVKHLSYLYGLYSWLILPLWIFEECLRPPAVLKGCSRSASYLWQPFFLPLSFRTSAQVFCAPGTIFKNYLYLLIASFISLFNCKSQSCNSSFINTCLSLPRSIVLKNLLCLCCLDLVHFPATLWKIQWYLEFPALLLGRGNFPSLLFC